MFLKTSECLLPTPFTLKKKDNCSQHFKCFTVKHLSY